MPSNYNFAYTLSTTRNASERRTTQLVIDSDSYFQVEKITAYYTKRFKAAIYDTARSMPWSNIPLVAENFFGTAQFPNRLQTKIMLPPSATVYFDLENLEADASEIFITLEGNRIYSPVTMPKRSFYVNAVDMALASLNILDANLVISNQGDFTVEKLVRYYDDEAELRISATGLESRNLFSGLTHIDNIFGNCLNPNILAHPYTLNRNSLLQIYARNRVAAVNNIQLCFEGSVMLGEGSPEIVK